MTFLSTPTSPTSPFYTCRTAPETYFENRVVNRSFVVSYSHSEKNGSSFPSLCSSFHMSTSHGMHVPPHSSSPCSGMGWYADHIPTLERDFCSDFTCCGQPFADLHELIDHFEEAHVIVIGPDGNSIYPGSQTGYTDRALFPCYAVTPFSKVVFEDPRAWNSDAVSTSPRGPAATTRCPPVPESQELVADFDMFSGAWTNASADQLCLPPSSFTAGTNADIQHSTIRSHNPGSSSCLPSRTEKKRLRGHGGSRRRDKLYKCPRPGCIKSYLNPNGLKYHLEKGTCSVEPAFYGDNVEREL
ncbi:hypothetical protein BS17DRAFT_787344 [Gyrodon lividus]|nr:hypothetical protein BS17DRAFT_787344 [Gyrodon lividus]